MKFYKDEKNQVYAYEANGSQDEYIKSNLVQIEKAEADELRVLPPSTPEELQAITNAEAKAYLESTAWYAERGYDFIISNGQYGAPMPEDILVARQAARDAIV